MLLRRLVVAGSLITRLLPAIGAGVAVAVAFLSARKERKDRKDSREATEDLPKKRSLP